MAVTANVEEQIRRMTPVAARPQEREDIRALLRVLETPPHGRCELVGPSGEKILIPQSVFYVLERVAEVLARGDSITVVPVGQEMTTQQAADMLNVSRQYLVRLLDEGRIPHTKIGRHRRVRIEDVLAFKAERDQERRRGLAELTKMSEDMGGYDELD